VSKEAFVQYAHIRAIRNEHDETEMVLANRVSGVEEGTELLVIGYSRIIPELFYTPV
jgi:hypothetical protein